MYILGLLTILGTLGASTWIMSQKAKSGAKIAVLEDQKNENEIQATVKGICADGSCVADTLKEELCQEQGRLLEEVKKAFPLTQEKWAQTLQNIESAKAQDTLITENPVIKHGKDDLPVVKKTREILASYNINPERVTIKLINNPKIKTNAAAYQGFIDGKVVHDLELNIPQLSQHPEDVQEAIIRHETMHFINYDSLTRAYIEVMFLENGITHKEFMAAPALQNLYQHQEFRADLFAACGDIKIARSFQKDFEHYIATYPQEKFDTCKTHPSDLARHKAVTQLIGYLEAESKIKLA